MAMDTAARAAWPFVALAGFVAGSALQLQQARLWPWPAYAALLAGGIALACACRCRWRDRVLATWLAALVAGGALGAGLAGGRASAYAARALDPALEGRDLWVTGVVSELLQRVPGGVRLRFDVESAAPGAPRLPPHIGLSWYADSAGDLPGPPRAGQRWRLPVRLKALHGTFNPHGFDLELWAWTQGLQATGYVRGAGRGGTPRQLAASGWRHPVERAREAVRDGILRRVTDERAAGVLAALVVGDQTAIARADWDLFRLTGVAHLMSISGLHVTLFAWLAAGTVGWLWRRSARCMLRWPAQQAGWVGGVGLATAYALFSGWGVPSQRTVCMLAVLALLRIGGLRWPWPLSWLVACAAVVALDPWALLQPGFWLSFVAVGVLFAADAGRSAPVGPAWRHVPLRLLREQAVVTLALTPLTLLLFQQVSLVGLLANLLAIPWVTLGVLPAALLGVGVPPLWPLAAWLVHGLMAVLQALAGWPLANLSLPAPPLWAGMAGVAGGLLLALRLPWSLRALGAPLLLPALLWSPARPAPGAFDVLAADVGQGGAVLVRTARHALLFDAGPRFGRSGTDAGQRLLVPLLRALGERPELLLLSHGDGDHVGGAQAILDALPGARVMGSLAPDHALRAGRPVEACVAGRRWQWDGVHFELLHPPWPADAARAADDPNAQSCVLRVVAANGSATLLTGDIEAAQEDALVATRRGAGGLRADLLVAPHHGSRTSSSAAFIAAVRPSVVVFQAGYRNRFGHPAPQVLARYLRAGAQPVDAPACGALHWRSDAPGAWACERALRRRYWHHEAASPPP